MHGDWYTVVGFQLNSLSHSPLPRKRMSYVKLRTYVSTRSKIIKQEVKLFNIVYQFEGFKSMGVKDIRTLELCKL